MLPDAVKQDAADVDFREGDLRQGDLGELKNMFLKRVHEAQLCSGWRRAAGRLRKSSSPVTQGAISELGIEQGLSKNLTEGRAPFVCGPIVAHRSRNQAGNPGPSQGSRAFCLNETGAVPPGLCTRRRPRCGLTVAKRRELRPNEPRSKEKTRSRPGRWITVLLTGAGVLVLRSKFTIVSRIP